VLLKRALLAALIALAPVTALAQTPIPRLVSGINDPDRLLDVQRIADLNKKLAAAEQRKDIQFVVLVARDIAPEKTARYGERALALWRDAAGAKSRVVLLVVIAEAKAAWLVEHGTELTLSDAQQIVFETIVPKFGTGHDIASGIDAGMNQVISVLDGTPLPPPPDQTGAWHSLVARLDGFRYDHEGPAGSGPLREFLFLAIGVALGLGARPFAGRWLAALLAALVAGFGSWLQYGFIVPFAAVAFVIVVFGWRHWLGRRNSTTSGG
jgi:uncharacterized protein